MVFWGHLIDHRSVQLHQACSSQNLLPSIFSILNSTLRDLNCKIQLRPTCSYNRQRTFSQSIHFTNNLRLYKVNITNGICFDFRKCELFKCGLWQCCDSGNFVDSKIEWLLCLTIPKWNIKKCHTLVLFSVNGAPLSPPVSSLAAPTSPSLEMVVLETISPSTRVSGEVTTYKNWNNIKENIHGFTLAISSMSARTKSGAIFINKGILCFRESLAWKRQQWLQSNEVQVKTNVEKVTKP